MFEIMFKPTSLEFKQYHHQYISDWWMGTSLLVRITPGVQKDILKFPDMEINKYRIIGVSGTWYVVLVGK